MACAVRNSLGEYKSHGWEITYFDRGDGYLGAATVDSTLLHITCREDSGSTPLLLNDVQSLLGTRSFNVSCMGKPLRPIWLRFDKSLDTYYRSMTDSN